LPYEIAMLRAAALILAESQPSRNDHSGLTRRYAAIESFLIHFRTLYSFFFEARVHPRDAVASHFFDDGAKWRERHGLRQTALLRRTAELADKLVAHLSYDRIDILAAGEGVRWADALAEIETAATAFTDSPRQPALAGDSLGTGYFVLHAFEYGPETTVSTPASAGPEFIEWLQSLAAPKDKPAS